MILNHDPTIPYYNTTYNTLLTYSPQIPSSLTPQIVYITILNQSTHIIVHPSHPLHSFSIPSLSHFPHLPTLSTSPSQSTTHIIVHPSNALQSLFITFVFHSLPQYSFIHLIHSVISFLSFTHYPSLYYPSFPQHSHPSLPLSSTTHSLTSHHPHPLPSYSHHQPTLYTTPSQSTSHIIVHPSNALQ